MLLRSLLSPLMAPATDEGALAAISAAIENPGGATPPDGGADNADAGAGAGGEGGEAGSGDGAGAGGGDAGAGAGEGAQGEPTAEELAAEQAAKEANDKAGDGEAAGEPPAGHERDAKGRFVKKAVADPAQAKPAKGAQPEIDPATGKPKVATPAAKKADHVNDPIPEEIKGRTRERMQGLVDVAKDLDTKLKAASTELEGAREFIGMVEATGAAPETFARHMDVLALMHSDDPGDKAKVVKYLRAAADKIGGELGETPAGKDPLEGHQDLLDEVDAGELPRKHAEEIAKARNTTAAAERLRTESNNRTAATSAADTAKAATKTALNSLTTELRKKDGDEIYNRKHAVLVPFIRRLNPTLSSDQVVKAVREAYAALELPAVTPSNRAPAGTGAQQPGRHRQSAGGALTRAPKTPEEALELGLQDEARARGAA